jgi:hypothetical protein
MPPLMRSELPVLCRTRHHWSVLMRLPGKWAALALIALFVWAVIAPAVWAVVAVVLAVALFVRWQTWEAEQIILTRKRIIRVQGVPETTKSEAFLRVDRISGLRIVQSVPGKLFDYATIELDKIWHPHEFYRELRHVIFSEQRADPDDGGPMMPPEDVTAPIPRITPPSLRRR